MAYYKSGIKQKRGKPGLTFEVQSLMMPTRENTTQAVTPISQLSRAKQSLFLRNATQQQQQEEGTEFQQHCKVLERIIEKAEKKYKKENQLNISVGPSFNLLRVLSAYKQHYPHNCPEVYNLIIYLTQIYKPNTTDQWYFALNQILLKERQRQKSKSRDKTRPKTLNGRKVCSRSEFQSLQNRRMKDFTQKSSSRSSNRSKIMLSGLIQNCPLRKESTSQFCHEDSQQVSSRTDQIPMNVCQEVPHFHQENKSTNKAHYISFQPGQQNKQNLGSDNCRHTRDSIGKTYTHSYHLSNLNQEEARSNCLIQKQSQYDVEFDLNQSSLEYLRSKHEKSRSSYQLHKKLHLNKSNHYYQLSHPFISQTNKNYQQTLSGVIQAVDAPFTISKIAYQTKELEEVSRMQNSQEKEQISKENIEQTEQWYQMSLRAAIFYRLNVEMKSFSALLANYAAHSDYRQARNKAQHFQTDSLKRKAIQGLKIHIVQVRNHKQILRQADQYRQQVLMKKTFIVLKVLFLTRISNRRKLPDKQSFNLASLSFIELLLLKQLQQKETPRQEGLSKLPHLQNMLGSNQNITINGTSTPKSLPQKGDYFTHTGQLNKLMTLFEYFSCYKPTIQQVETFYKLKTAKILTNCFQSWKINTKNAISYEIKHQTFIKKKVIYALLKQVIRRRQQEKNNTFTRIISERTLLKKAFQGLLQIVYSTKIIAKRTLLISQKQKFNAKHLIIRVWREHLNAQMAKTIMRKTKIPVFIKLIPKLALHQPLQIIRNFSKQVEAQRLQNEQQQRVDLLKTIFYLLKQKATLGKEKKIRQLQKDYTLKQQYFAQWRAKVGLNMLFQAVQRLIFRRFFNSTGEIVQRKKAQLDIAQNMATISKNKVFEALKNNLVQEIRARTHKEQQLSDLIRKVYQESFMRNLKLNKQTSKMSERFLKVAQLRKNMRNTMISENLYVKASERTNRKVLKDTLMFTRRVSFISRLRERCDYNHQLQQNLQICKVQTFNSKVKTGLFVLRNHRMFQKASVQLKTFVNAKRKLQSIQRVKRQLKQKKQFAFLHKRQCSIQLVAFNGLKKFRDQRLATYDMSTQHHELVTGKKVFLGLIKQLLEADQKTKMLQQNVLYQRKQCSMRLLSYQTTNTKQIDQKFSQLINLRFLSRLKEDRIKQQSKNSFLSFIDENRKKKVFQKLQENRKSQYQNVKKNKSLECFTKLLSEKLFKIRFEQYFVNQMIDRKFECTALKFRATKLCNKVIGSLQTYFFNEKGYHITDVRQKKQNLSTEYSFSRQF